MDRFVQEICVGLSNYLCLYLCLSLFLFLLTHIEISDYFGIKLPFFVL